VLRAAGESETMKEIVQYSFQLDEGHPGFQLLTEKEIAAVIYFYLSSARPTLLNFQFISFLSFFF
jgi:hypothetical protein